MNIYVVIRHVSLDFGPRYMCTATNLKDAEDEVFKDLDLRKLSLLNTKQIDQNTWHYNAIDATYEILRDVLIT